MAEMVERLSRFDGPPEQFLVNLLAVQCHLAAADGGAILRIGREQQAEILAVYPQPAPGSTAPVWLAQSAESAAQIVADGKTALRPLHGPDDLYGQPASRHLVMLPLRGGSGVLGVATFVVTSADPQVLAAVQQRLELTVSLLSLYEMRLTLQQRQGDIRRLRLAMETVATFNEQERFKGAAMALCNEAASRWRCDRVGLGFLKGRYIQLKALSHTEKFSRKMQLVQDIEAAMEEALDQDVEIMHPTPQGATFVSRASAELSKKHGPSALLSLPLRHGGEVAAVLTLERPLDESFRLDEVESLRLTCDLATPRLVNLHKHDRWFGARAVAGARSAAAVLLGPKHTWVKLLGILAFVFILFLILVPGTFRAEAPFVLEATTQQVVPAPFDGYLKQVYVVPGQVVVGSNGRASWLLTSRDIRDWPALLAQLRLQADADAPSPGKHVLSLMSAQARQAVSRAPVGTEPDEQTRTALLGAFNDLLSAKALYDREAWSPTGLTDRQKDLLAERDEGTIDKDRMVELNRSLLASAYPGKIAPGPTVLATLDTVDLELELIKAEAERMGYLKQKAKAMAEAAFRDDKRAEAQVYQAQADQVSAQIRLLKHRIEQATIVSPIDGAVVTGDLKRQLGAPAQTGSLLFEVASLADLRADLSVPEDLIADVQAALQKARNAEKPLPGELATNARPDRKIPFTVQRIDPVAKVVEQKNVFNVRVRLGERPGLLMPGMEGVGKIDIDRRSYLYIWTRKLINWVRMKLWI